MARSVSIRQSLLNSLVLTIIVLSGAILAATFVGGQQARTTVVDLLITKNLELMELRLRGFFDPVVRDLQLARRWADEGLLDLEAPETLERVLRPLMEDSPRVSSIMVADLRGREFMLLRSGERWRIRVTRRDEWGDRVRWREWTESEPEPVESWEDLDYDPRGRPWFAGAVANADRPPSEAVHWTRPYTFFTTREPGITASIPHEGADGALRVIGFDVLLSDISKFTTALRISDLGRVVVLTDDRRIIGLPYDPRYTDISEHRSDLLKRPDELGLTLASDAAAAFQEHGPEEAGPMRFSSEGQTWWGRSRRFALTPQNQLFIAVVVPQSELIGQLDMVRLVILAVTLLVLAGAIARAFGLARRFSQPIEALVRESDRIGRGDLEPGEHIDSGVKEVRRLVRAQDRMRTSLHSLVKMERDIQLARDIQQSTFPHLLPALEGFEIDARSDPADETGGDLYDIVGVPAGERDSGDDEDHDTIPCIRATLVLADATGHGIGPALSVTQVRAMLRMAVRMRQPLPFIARHLNEQLHADLPEGRFITAWLGELDAETRTLITFSAGQAPLLHYVAADDALHALAADTLPFGVLPELLQATARPIRMQPGDLFAVISDGIYEAADPDGAFFGQDRVAEVLREHKDQPVGRIIEALWQSVDVFARGRPADDDRTAIIIRCTA